MEFPDDQIKAVSHRNEFTPIPLMIEMYARTDSEKALLKRFANALLLQMDCAQAKAIANALHQVNELMKDPIYAAKRKRRIESYRGTTVTVGKPKKNDGSLQ